MSPTTARELGRWISVVLVPFVVVTIVMGVARGLFVLAHCGHLPL